MHRYESRSAGLGLEFARLVRAAFAAIERAPLQFPEVEPDVRRAIVRRFPYAALFVIETDRISVLAVFHHRRNPERWKARR